MSSKKVELWMPLLVDKYLGDTTHLTTEQHGAYLLLLMSCWKKDGALPADDTQLRKITGLDPEPWAASKKLLLAFFERDGDTYRQKRLTVELERAKANVEQRSAAGKASAAKRAAEREANGKATDVATGVSTSAPTTKATTDQREPERNGKPIPIPGSEPNGSADAGAPASVDKSASEGSAPAEPNPGQQAKRAAWRDCGNWLVQNGVAESSARELMGLILRDHPAIALDAFVAAPKVGTTPDPRAYLQATAKRMDGERKTVPSADAARTAEYLAQREQQAEAAASPEAHAARQAAMERVRNALPQTRAAA